MNQRVYLREEILIIPFIVGNDAGVRDKSIPICLGLLGGLKHALHCLLLLVILDCLLLSLQKLVQRVSRTLRRRWCRFLMVSNY